MAVAVAEERGGEGSGGEEEDAAGRKCGWGCVSLLERNCICKEYTTRLGSACAAALAE